MTIYRNTSTEEHRKFWEGVDESAKLVARWPFWMIDWKQLPKIVPSKIVVIKEK